MVWLIDWLVAWPATSLRESGGLSDQLRAAVACPFLDRPRPKQARLETSLHKGNSLSGYCYQGMYVTLGSGEEGSWIGSFSNPEQKTTS